MVLERRKLPFLPKAAMNPESVKTADDGKEIICRFCKKIKIPSADDQRKRITVSYKRKITLNTFNATSKEK